MDLSDRKLEDLYRLLYGITIEVLTDLDINVEFLESEYKNRQLVANDKVIGQIPIQNYYLELNYPIAEIGDFKAAWDNILGLVAVKEDILRELYQEVLKRLPSKLSLKPTDSIILYISETENIMITVGFWIVNKDIFNVRPLKLREKLLLDNYIDFSRLEIQYDTILFCHGKTHSRPAILSEEEKVLYLDINKAEYPDLVSDIFEDKYSPCHCPKGSFLNVLSNLPKK